MGRGREEASVKEYQITCINKPDRFSPHEHISHIGNVTWRMSREEAVRRIDSKQEAFFTIDKTTGRKVYIGVVRGDGFKAPYLRTHADGKWNDNLLALDECNGACQLIT
jgi:hypothetical protein